MNPFSPSNTQASEYLAYDKSPPKHLSVMTTILIVHATLSLVGSLLTLFAPAHLHASSAGMIPVFISSSFLLLTAYLLYRRNKWAFIPALLYMLQRWATIYAAYALFQSYTASHPDQAGSFAMWQEPLFLLTAFSTWIFPAIIGAVYTAYCLYHRKRGLLA